MKNRSDLPSWLVPNSAMTVRQFNLIALAWGAVLLLLWVLGAAPFIPTPSDVFRALPNLWFNEGLGAQIWESFSLNLQAVGVMFALSCFVAYATTLPLFRPFAAIVSAGRFNGFVGLPLIFMAMFHDAHVVKVALLVFGMGVFTVLSMVKMIEAIPKEAYDHSRTLRMNEWRVVWEVVILGQLDQVIDIMRVNVAMGWMMLPMVEGMYKFEGGVGALLENEAKHLNLDSVFCVVLIVLMIGILQDWAIGQFKQIVCPYAELGMERV